MIRAKRHSRSRHVPPDAWRKSDALLEDYARRLRAVAREVGRLASPLADDPTLAGYAAMERAMRRYADALEPWAGQIARRMWDRADAQDRAMWGRVARMMGRHLRAEVEDAPTGQAQAEFMARQVGLIKSIPLEAAERVHKYVLEGQMNALRPAELAGKIEELAGKEELSGKIEETSKVAQSRAMLIARTEISRAATDLTRARAESIGSVEYEWLTSNDADVRASHRRLNGRRFRWDDPPECDPGHHAHPGQIWNCRCVAAPVIPDL